MDRDFHYTDKDFRRVKTIIYERAGINLSDAKEHMVYSRLARRLRALDMERFQDYLDMLVRDPESDEWEHFTNALTTNLTSFFRESHHFDILADFLAKKPKGHTFHIWCSASSTGEEPYSIAMTMVEALGKILPPGTILASDLDTNVLTKAENGVYSLERLEKLQVERKRQFFLRGKGDKSGFARVRSELREMISYRQINLLDSAWPIRGPFDAIFCRNVLIYFDKETQRKVLEKFAPLLADDGLLFVGHSESLQHVSDLFSPCGKTVYRLANKHGHKS